MVRMVAGLARSTRFFLQRDQAAAGEVAKQGRSPPEMFAYRKSGRHRRLHRARACRRKKHPRRAVHVVVPNLRDGVLVDVAKILSVVMREAAWGDTATRIDEH